MLQLFSQPLPAVSLDRIDGEDRTFALSPPWTGLKALRQSIRRAGILTPLHLEARARGRYRIVRGFRRHRIALELGLERIPALVSEGVPLLDLFLAAFHDNLASRPLHELEGALALDKLQSEFGLDEEILIEEYLPLLGIRPDRFHLRRHLALARLPTTLQEALISGRLDGEVATKLASWREDGQRFFLERATRHRLGRNKQRELFELLDELATAGERSTRVPVASALKDLWRQSGAAALEQNDQLPPHVRFERITESLRRLRFPELSRHEERYQELRAALNLPSQIHFRAPRFFEGDRLQVSFEIRDPQELLPLAEKLRAVAKQEEFREIFELF